MPKRHAFTAILAALAAGCAPAAPSYPAPWRDTGPVFWEIAKTFGAKGITGCGEFYYRTANGAEDPGEALVYCTADGKTWDAYLVFYRTGSVLKTAKDEAPPY